MSRGRARKWKFRPGNGFDDLALDNALLEGDTRLPEGDACPEIQLPTRVGAGYMSESGPSAMVGTADTEYVPEERSNKARRTQPKIASCGALA
jgi:hypothetical protein